MKTFLLCVFSLPVFSQLAPSQTGKNLDKNYVKAAIYTTNDRFWRIYTTYQHAYEAPVGSGRHAMSANSVWIGGLDNSGGLHIAANTFKQSGTDFWPGPLDTSNIGFFNSTNSIPYNKLWKVDCKDISNFVTAFNDGSVANGSYIIPSDILTYPAKGTANFQKNLCPFVDVNNNGLYNPQTEGDYPLIKGNQQILSIYNDQNGTHTETNGANMGLEIHERSYAYFDSTLVDSMQAVNYTTFYHYTIYNRSSINYMNTYITDWADIDIGYYANDYIGTDSANAFAYCYNATPTDPTGGGVPGYGSRLPVLSHAILKTNCGNDNIDNNNNGVIDETGEQFVLNKTTYYNNNINTFPPQTTNPSLAIHYYNYMSGFWKDSSPFSYGGSAYGGSVISNYVFTGNPTTPAGWSEITAAGTPGDRRLLLSSGPFNFPAGAKIEWGYAIVFSQDTALVSNAINQFDTRVRRDVRNAKYYDETHSAMQCATAPPVTTGINKNALSTPVAFVYPNPSSGNISVDLSENVKTAMVRVVDVVGNVTLQKEMKDTYRTQLDLSGFGKGIYFVEISTDKGTLTKKIIKN